MSFFFFGFAAFSAFDMSLICAVEEKATTTSCSKKGFEVGDSFWHFLVGEPTRSSTQQVVMGRSKEACVGRGASSA